MQRNRCDFGFYFLVTQILLAYLDIPTCYFVSTRVCFCNFEQGPKLLCEG